jgi:transcriptional regulator with XRE-family HTH domain
MASVPHHNLSRATRFLRHRRRWRQQDLGEAAGVSREMISRLERGEVEALAVRSLERVAAALGATVRIDLRWNGEQLDRLMDAGHAALEQIAVASLRATGWRSEVEVSFNWYGDRGRCDAVAFHPETATLIVVEAKTRLGDVQDLLGRLDVKARLGRQLARQLGWPEPSRVLPCLVVADSRTARRIVASHADLFARFTQRGRAARRWLAEPDSGEVVGGILLFETLPDSHQATTRRRVRPLKPPSARDV